MLDADVFADLTRDENVHLLPRILEPADDLVPVDPVTVDALHDEADGLLVECLKEWNAHFQKHDEVLAFNGIPLTRRLRCNGRDAAYILSLQSEEVCDLRILLTNDFLQRLKRLALDDTRLPSRSLGHPCRRVRLLGFQLLHLYLKLFDFLGRHTKV